MLENIRRPLFVIAVALIAIAVLFEIGSVGLIKADLGGKAGALGASNPGLGIPYLALIDGLVLFTVLLVGVALLIPERIHGKIQGIITLVVSLLVLIACIVMIISALVKLALMLGLLLAPPFGTAAYLAIYSSFATGKARIALGLLMLLKLGFAGFLVFSHQRFLQNKGLVLIVLTSLLADVIISFLHGFVPGFLVSITDAVAAIIVAILAAIWSLLFLIGSITSVVKAIH